jgi:hypothetical protein
MIKRAAVAGLLFATLLAAPVAVNGEATIGATLPPAQEVPTAAAGQGAPLPVVASEFRYAPRLEKGAGHRGGAVHSSSAPRYSAAIERHPPLILGIGW